MTRMITGILTALLLVSGAAVFAKDKDEDRDKNRVAPVTDPLTLKRCGDCHIAYPAAFLPQRSWTALLARLSDHFGDDATLPEAERTAILKYFTANAGDRGGSKLLRGVGAAQTPLRITELPRWVKEHEEELSASVWALPSVKSRANCPACHLDAAKGDFSERTRRVPKS